MLGSSNKEDKMKTVTDLYWDECTSNLNVTISQIMGPLSSKETVLSCSEEENIAVSEI